MGHSKISRLLSVKLGHRVIIGLLFLVLLALAPFAFSDPVVWKRHWLEAITLIAALPLFPAYLAAELVPIYRLARSRYGQDRKKARADLLRYGLFEDTSVDEIREIYLRELRESSSPDEEALRRVEPAEQRFRREEFRLQCQLEDMGIPRERVPHREAAALLRQHGERAAKAFISGLSEYAILLARLKRAPWSDEVKYETHVWPLIDRFDIVGLRTLVDDVETKAALRIIGAQADFNGRLDIPSDGGDPENYERIHLIKDIRANRLLLLNPLRIRYDQIAKVSEEMEMLHENAYRCVNTDIDEDAFQRAYQAYKSALDKLVS